MSVYKEALNIIHQLNQACISTLIYNDAADSGLPVLKDDTNWRAIQQCINDFGIKQSIHKPYKGSVKATISIIQEFTTGAHEFYEIQYHTVWNHMTLITPCTGFFTIRKVMPTELDLINDLNRMQYDLHYPNGDEDLDPAGGYGLQSHI